MLSCPLWRHRNGGVSRHSAYNQCHQQAQCLQPMPSAGTVLTTKAINRHNVYQCHQQVQCLPYCRIDNGKHPESVGVRRENTWWHQAEESDAEGRGFRCLMPASDLPTRTTRRAAVFLLYRTYLWNKQQVMSINLTTWSTMQYHVVVDHVVFYVIHSQVRYNNFYLWLTIIACQLISEVWLLTATVLALLPVPSACTVLITSDVNLNIWKCCQGLLLLLWKLACILCSNNGLKSGHKSAC